MFNFSPTLNKIAKNLTWLSIDRFVRLFGAVFINAWITRYFGPEQYGIYSYAIAFVGIFSPLAVLGLDAIVIRDIVRNPELKDEILGSAFALRLIGALLALLFSIFGIFIFRTNEPHLQLLVALTSIGLIFQAFDVIDYWFQSQVISKYTVYARNIAFFILSIAKIIAIFLNAKIYVFIILTSLELFVAAICLIIMYNKKGQFISNWNFKFSRMKALLTNSWPIIISDLAVFAQTRIDQVMIGEFLNISDVGFYAAAQKISEPLGFIPMIIMSSVYPLIVKTKEWSEKEYFSRLTNLYRLMFIIFLAISIPIAIFSDSIVQILYGNEFKFSATLLSFIIWGRFYAFFGVIRSIFISTENLFKHILICSLSGITVSIIGNYFLLQKIGVYGSIVSTHLGFITTIFLIDGFSKKTKNNFNAMIRGLTTFYKFSIK